MWPLRRVLKYGTLGTALIGTGLSLHTNHYDVNSIGIVRLSRAVLTVYKIGYCYKTNLYYKEWDKSTIEYKTEKKKAHKIAAEKLLELICTNKGVYIKVGQHIAALEYLIPSEFVQTMKILHSDAPTNPVEDMYKVIRQDLKQDPSELFASFDPEPLGTASLAQVHGATLKTGERVAVKVQHPYVKGNSRVDMKTMEVLYKLMSFVFPEFKMGWLIEESKKNLPIELDFLNEGKNAEKVSEMYKEYKWLKVPKIYWELSSKRVLVMEYLEGGKVDDLSYIQKNEINPFEVANKLGQLYSNMIFRTGFVHSDPHPGNILVKKNKNGSTDIILLDHGLYANLTDKFRFEYSKLWMSILRVDRVGMKRHCNNLGIRGELYGLFACMVTGRPWESVMAGLSSSKTDVDKEKQQLQENGSLVINHIADILDQVDRQMLLILKTNDLIRGIEATLGTLNRKTAFWVMSKCCVKTMHEESRKNTESQIVKMRTTIHERWVIMKLNLYYLYMGVLNFSFFSSLKMLF